MATFVRNMSGEIQSLCLGLETTGPTSWSTTSSRAAATSSPGSITESFRDTQAMWASGGRRMTTSSHSLGKRNYLQSTRWGTLPWRCPPLFWQRRGISLVCSTQSSLRRVWWLVLQTRPREFLSGNFTQTIMLPLTMRILQLGRNSTWRRPHLRKLRQPLPSKPLWIILPLVGK